MARVSEALAGEAGSTLEGGDDEVTELEEGEPASALRNFPLFFLSLDDSLACFDFVVDVGGSSPALPCLEARERCEGEDGAISSFVLTLECEDEGIPAEDLKS